MENGGPTACSAEPDGHLGREDVDGGLAERPAPWAGDANGKAGESTGPHAALQVEPIGAPGKPAKRAFPWRGGIWDRGRAFLLSDRFQAAAQLALGTLVVSLFTFVHPLRFRQSCLSTIFFVAAMLLVANDCHVGSRLAGCAIILGGLWFGGLLSASAISLARLCTGAYTTALILFMAVALLLTTTLRVKANLGVGIISNLGLGIMVVSGQFVWPARDLWGYTYTAILRIGVVASLGVAVAGLLVLPSLAGDELRLKVAHILQDLGKVVSEDAGHLLLRRQDEAAALDASGSGGGAAQRAERALSARLRNLRSQDEAEVAGNTDPGRERRPPWTRQKGVVTTAQLRPALTRCRELWRMSALEPAFLRVGGAAPYRTFRWQPVLDALEALLMRVAALECITEGEDPMLLDSELLGTLGLSLLPAFSLMFAQVAAACAAAAGVVKRDVQQSHRAGPLLFEPSWALLEYEVAGVLHDGLKAFWTRMAAGTAKDFVNPTPEIRALMFLGTVGTSVMEALSAFETALQAALHDPGDARGSPQPVQDAIAVVRASGLRGPLGVNIIQAPPDEPAPASALTACDEDMSREKAAAQEDIEDTAALRGLAGQPTAFVSFRRSMGQRPLQQKMDAAASAGASRRSRDAAPPPAKRPPPQWAMANVVWLIPLLKAALFWDVVGVVRSLLTVDLPREFSSPAKAWATLRRGRWFQFGLKYYAASVVSLSTLLALQSHYPEVRRWNGLYILITVIVVLSEKVDTTFQKGLLRIATTVVGGVVGYVVMLDYRLATNPYGLAAITVAFAFSCGLLATNAVKYAIFLTLITLDGVVLCQYTGRTAGTHINFYSRLTVTVWGVLLCLAFDLLFPWYAGTAALQALGGGLEAAGEVLREFVAMTGEELELAYLHAAEPAAAAASAQQGVRRLEAGWLQRRIAQPLGSVQVSLAREGVLWRRGVLAMPRLVGRSICQMQAVLDRLVAVELMLLQKPIVSGRYSGATWHFLHRHMMPPALAVADACKELCAAAAAAMGEFPRPADLERLERAIATTHAARVAFRGAYRQHLNAYLGLIREGPGAHPLLAQRSIDDGVRYQSLVFAIGKAFDRIVLLARMVADDPWTRQRAAHRHSWQTLHVWTGRHGY